MLIACHLAKGYFPAWGFKADLAQNDAHLEQLARYVGSPRNPPELAIDHVPDPHRRTLPAALGRLRAWSRIVLQSSPAKAGHT